MPIRERRRLNRSAKAGRGFGQGRCRTENGSEGAGLGLGLGRRIPGRGEGRLQQSGAGFYRKSAVASTKMEKPFMKIAISTTENSTAAVMDDRFGRAPGFILLDTSTSESEFIDNQKNADAGQSAGIQSAQALVNKGVDAVISGHCGPKAFRVLNDAGVRVFMSSPVKVSEAISQLQAGQLEQQLS
jgi:predicted Fe-Mo cluster-binding NifX family protein